MTLSETIIATINQNVLHPCWWRRRDDISVAEKLTFTTMQAPYSMPISGNHRLKSHERVIALHDALAELLVREDQAGAVAIASALSTQGLIVFVTSDENKELELIAGHLRNIWASLQQIFRTKLDSATEQHSERAKRRLEFRHLIYEYSWNKHMQRYDKYKDPDLPRFFEEVLDNSYHVTDIHPENGSYIHSSEVEAIQYLRAICRFMDRCKSANSLDGDGLNDHALYIANFLHKLDGLKQDASIRWSRVLYKMIGRTPRYPLPIFFEKISFVERTIQEVLRLPQSRHLSSILCRDIIVIPVTIEPVLLKYDLLDDPDLRELVEQADWTAKMFEDTWKKAASEGKGIWKLERIVYPHCECALLAHLAVNIPRMPEDTRPYGCVGVSDNSCTGCLLYFSAYNDVAEKARLPKIYMSRSRAHICRPWAKPEIAHEQLNANLDSQLCARARTFLDEGLEQARWMLDFVRFL